MLALFLASAPLAAQLSPGKLSQPHAKLEGSANCLKCHQAGQGVAPSKCLDCHTAIKSSRLHARPEYRACQTCHIEHHGREFQLIDWGKKGQAGFDHRLTGWPLQGAHAKQACQSCHRPPKKTFLGLSPTCRSCHEDEHRGQFAQKACVSCHTTAAWKPLVKLDHSVFPLTGLHQKVACASCHPGGQFKGIQHQSCSSCHKDPHQGRFGATCQQCHSTTGWKTTGFDHSRTGFPLTGQHKTVACASCHKSGKLTKLAHQRCTDCHKDPHQGRLGTSCQQCHSTTGWNGAKVDHDRTRFPLRGAHQKVSCQSCHTSGRSLRFAKFQACADCHKNVHAGQIASSACESCHTLAGFSPSTFTMDRHQKTGFPLQGAHLAVPCISCHKKNASGVVRFNWESTECQACHGDPHKGQLVQAGCQSCHSVQGWARVTFDHDRQSRFKLEGAHARLPCAKCHGKNPVRFKPLPITCEGCHLLQTGRNS
ncbi:MAG TPA: cytochrome c3 family protein [Thermoanaerobaculia bacterium]|nr:cytochrome c3 family protein [Thermoanaerobaculia bacterium]